MMKSIEDKINKLKEKLDALVIANKNKHQPD